MAVGVDNEVIAGDKATISIAGDVYDLKEIFDLTRDRTVAEDGNSSGTCYTFGSGRHKIDILIAASTPDLAAIDAFNNRDANGDLPSKAIIISYPPVGGGGATVTESFNAKFHTMKRSHGTVTEKIKIRLTGVITSETSTWG